MMRPATTRCGKVDGTILASGPILMNRRMPRHGFERLGLKRQAAKLTNCRFARSLMISSAGHSKLCVDQPASADVSATEVA